MTSRTMRSRSGVATAADGNSDFHPRKVPSYSVDGKRYPVCAGCMEGINQRRQAQGLPRFAVETGAYDVAATVIFPRG